MFTLVYDGECGFCSTAVRYMDARMRGYTSIPYQHADLKALGLTLEQVQDRVWLVTPTQRLGGETAVIAVLKLQRPGWHLLGTVLDLPVLRGLTRVGYRWVSRNRYRLPGGTPACSLPPVQR